MSGRRRSTFSDRNKLLTHDDQLNLMNPENDKKYLEDLFQKTADLTGIGVWEFDSITNTVYWSGMTKIIHQVAPDYKPSLKSSFGFYKGSKEKRFIRSKIKKSN